jgi:hypothetical protein
MREGGMKTGTILGIVAVLLTYAGFPAGAATIYLATTDSAGTTSGENASVTAAIGSAIQVANSYGYSAVKLSKAFDPANPLDLCAEASRPSRPQALAPQAAPAPQQQVAPPPAHADEATTLQPGDLLVVLSVTRADQEFNKFTGAFTNDVLLNLTQINCPTAAAPDGTKYLSKPSGVISKGWGRASQGALIERYNENPITGIASVAALLTSPWVNKYRLWLTVPTTFLDSFKHEKRSLEGTVYCATTEAVLDLLYQNQRIKIATKEDKQHPVVPAAYRKGDDDQWYRVPGVNYCREPQPVRPKLNDPPTEPSGTASSVATQS